MNNLRITPCNKAPEYKAGEILTIKPRKNPKQPEDYLILRATQDNNSIFALPINKGKEVELFPRTLTALNGSDNIRATGVLNYVA